MIWFTADNHFFHKNVITLCGRPFADNREMHHTMIRLWNECVEEDDTIIVVGDFTFGGVQKTANKLDKLNGKKMLVMGNHDWRNHKPDKYEKMGFDHVCKRDFSILLDETPLIVSHYPYKGSEIDNRVFDTQLTDEGDWLVHGHVHNAWKKKGRMINVGVDVRGFKPVSLPEILREMATTLEQSTLN